MSTRLDHSRLLQIVGILLAGTGVALLASIAFATEAALGITLFPAAALLLAAGTGVLLRRVWGWYLALVVAGSGAVVVAARLVAADPAEWPSLLAPLCLDLLLLIVLVWERPHRLSRPFAAGQ